jgi:hypothetical protein
MEIGGHVTPDCVVQAAQVSTTQQIGQRLGLIACIDMEIKKKGYVPRLDEQRTLALQLKVSNYNEMACCRKR